MAGSVLIPVFSCKKKSETLITSLNNQIVAQWEKSSDSIYAASKITGMLIGIWAPDRNLSGYCPEKNLTIVISYNSTISKPMVMAARLMNIYLGAVT